MDDFNTLSNRLLSRCPAVGIQLSQQLINDVWRTFQSRREWSFRRKSYNISPPDLYQAGTASSNVASGNPNLITGIGTTWTQDMVGRQIRLFGLLKPYYTIQAFLGPTQLLIDMPWAGPDVTSVPYQIVKSYYEVPEDFGYWYVMISLSGAYRLWTTATEADLAVFDPQRTNQTTPIAVVFRDYVRNFGGTIGPVIPVAATGPAPISTTTSGYSYIANATFILQVTSTGASGVASFQWMRSGQTGFTGPVLTADSAVSLQDGVQVYWPDGVTYNSGDLFIINCQSQLTTGVPRYEIWPCPLYAVNMLTSMYIQKEYDITVSQPQLPPFVANRGEVLLEMALAACARYPGPDLDHPNPYFNLNLAQMHDARCEVLLNDMERNDNEIGDIMVNYQEMELAAAPWNTGSWRQRHSPYLIG